MAVARSERPRSNFTSPATTKPHDSSPTQLRRHRGADIGGRNIKGRSEAMLSQYPGSAPL